MKPPPPGWPRLSVSVYYDDPAAAIDWLCEAFGFEVRLKVEGEGGRIEHSELTYGEALIMVGGTGVADSAKSAWQKLLRSPRSISGGMTQSACLHLEDVDAHCARARAAGATIVCEPESTDYGDDYWADRSYGALDLEGHLWWFMQRLKTGKG
ncbi:MAG: VOC family protein [Vicinamibacteria bacterium]